MSNRIQIWCDGSYRDQHNTLGAAWVRAAEDGDLHPIEGFETLPKLQNSHKHGSDVAELMAFANALFAAPAGSEVDVHMDCQNVIDWITAGDITTKSKQQEPAVRKAFGHALAARALMAEVALIYTTDSSPNMRRAHVLSRTASTPGKDKVKKNNRHQHERHRRDRALHV